MFGIGDTELLLIIIFGFLLFGPDKLPGMGRTIGRGIRQFRQAQDSVTKAVRSEVIDPMTQAAGTAADGAKKAVTDEDDDIDADLSSRTTETFAERRARLAAEKAAAKEAASSEAAGTVAAATAAQADAAAATAEEAPAGNPASAPAEAPAEPERPRSAASLYGLDSAPKAAPAEAPVPEPVLPEAPIEVETADSAAGEEAGDQA